MIGGRYRVIERLGSGESTEVYRARDTLLEREVALKVLSAGNAGDAGRIESFRGAARSAASLSHPNIVQVYELGRSTSGLPFVATEYVEGGTLAYRLRDLGTLEPAVAAEVAARIAEALQAAHERGVYHCNLIPSKVLLTDSGTVKVTDFGVNCSRSGRHDQGSQANDLYSLGAVLYEMLTGIPPLSERNAGDSQIIQPPAELNPEVPARMSALTMRLIARSPDERPADAATILASLEEAVEASRFLSAAETSSLYKAKTGLPAVMAGSLKSLWTRFREIPGPGRQLSGPEQKLRRRRRRLLSLVPLVLLALVLGWAMYGGGINAASLGARQQPAAASKNPVTVPVKPGAATIPEKVLVHTASQDNISNNSTYLDVPEANGDPGARISITQNWNPEGSGGTYNDHPIGVWYDASKGKWAIFNQDRAAMPEGASFNVVIWGGDGG